MKKKLANNILSSVFLQITTIISGFVLPKLILSNFGSDVNGLVNSISQFLQIFAFLDMGVGAVVQSSLYKPLADNDVVRLSEVYVSGQKFFSKLSKILFVYVLSLGVIYPFIVNDEFSFGYTATLIIVMSVSSFAQYYFGMVNGLFLVADQKGYIQYNVQIVSILFNTLSCYLLIRIGASIHIVKLVTSLIYLIRPLVLGLYVGRHYSINKKIEYSGEPIKQKWNGLAQHIAAVILSSTDTIILTIFSTLENVSIYSVHFLVVSGLKQIFDSMMSGIQALLGELYAKQEQERLRNFFELVEWLIHTMTTFIFGCAGVLIVPFVMVYTKEITDADYNQPLFSGVLILAYAMYCIRLPYHMLIKASVHYKETQHCYWIAAGINLILSVILVNRFGLIGVALGTFVAMTYQTVWMARYDSKNIIPRSLNSFFKQLGIDMLTATLGVIFTKNIQIHYYSYYDWCVMAIKVAVIWGIVVIIINAFFYKEKFKRLLNIVGEQK